MDFSAVCGVMGIYAIRISDYVYIGQASNMRVRWSRHLSALRHNKHSNTFMQNVYNKYGEIAVSFSIIDETLESDLTPSEQWYLDTLKMFHPSDKILNLAPVAGSTLGTRRSAETRANMSAWQVGRTLSDETKALMRAAKLGKKKSAETRALMSAAQLNMSDETKAKIGAGNLGKKRSAETRALMSAARLGNTSRVKTYDIILLAPDGAQHGPINNIAAFERKHGLNRGNIHNVVTGKIKSHNGWRLFVSAEQT